MSLLEPGSLIEVVLASQPASRPAARVETADTTARFSLLSGERELIAAALAETAGNQSRAAQLLGIGRFSLRYKMKKLGML